MKQHTVDEIRQMRINLVTQIVDEFEKSGIEYTCGRVVMDFAKKRIVPLTEDWPASVKINRNMTFRRIERAAWDEMHRRWLKRRK